MNEWKEVFEELKWELVNGKQSSYIVPHMYLCETEKQLGYGSVTIDGVFTIKGIQVMKSTKSEGEYYLSLPAVKKNEEFYRTCTLEPDLYRQVLKCTVKDLLVQQLHQNQMNQEFKIDVRPVGKGNLIATAEVTYGKITLKQIRVLQGKTKRFIVFPQMTVHEQSTDMWYFQSGSIRDMLTKKILDTCDLLIKKDKTP